MNEDREYRMTLRESRDMKFEHFRRNLRIIRAHKDINASELADAVPELKSGKFVFDLEYGRANPSIEHILALSKYAGVDVDALMNKEATITFRPPTNGDTIGKIVADIAAWGGHIWGQQGASQILDRLKAINSI